MIDVGHAIEIAQILLVAYIFGCTFGYGAHILTRHLMLRPRVAPVSTDMRTSPPHSAARRLAHAAARDEAPLPSAEPSSPPQMDRAPPMLARSGQPPDDLKKIKGIGQKTESSLNELGIYQFAQIAAWGPDHIDWLEGRVAVRNRIRREQWVEQATLLATAPLSAAERDE